MFLDEKYRFISFTTLNLTPRIWAVTHWAPRGSLTFFYTSDIQTLLK